MGIVSTKLRNSAKGMACTFQIPGVCNHDNATTVLCHGPSDVKGMGNKSDDFHAAFGCSACHEALDQHRLEKWEEYFFWLRGIQRTQAYWQSKGLLMVPVDVPRQKQSPKIMPRRHPATREIIT
ncbi:nuclease domain-containing protein [Brucella intermedia]|uniref:nuclease domain-containing protein n=1 Tax=Brucella intermedia TaxID=94625 RepID=UPI00244C762F|nr:nuclease domain-containing protein [Brucella intermedia]WGG61826.1 DUF1364 family protein [Brucella intermedia]